jgi:hypothetical protein
MSTPNPTHDDEPLSDSERELLTGAIRGALLDLRTSDGELNDPAQGMNWGVSRQVRAELLIELLTGTRRPDGKLPRAIKLRGARITGSLDLEAVALVCPLLLQDCHIGELVNLDEATASAIRMPGCHLSALTARQLRTTGNLTLNRANGDPILNPAFTATRGINLEGAHIGGELNLDGASLTNPDGAALSADGLSVDLDMSCSHEFTATGEIRLIGAHIGGQLCLDGASMSNPGGVALYADRLTVDQSLFCQDGLTVSGEIRFTGAHIGGQLNLSRGCTLNNPGGRALSAESFTVDRDMICSEGLTANGEITLYGAHIGGDLYLNGAALANPEGVALDATSLTVGEHLLCGGGFRATGEIRLIGTRIGGMLSLAEAKFANPSGMAMCAVNLNVGSDMICGGRFTARGEICLPGAQIAGQLVLDGADLANPGEMALSARGLTVGQNMTGERLNVTGEVILSSAHIGGQLILEGASFDNPGGMALDASGMTVGQDILCGGGFIARGEIDLQNAKIAGELSLDTADLARFAGVALRDGVALRADFMTVGQGMHCMNGFTVTGEVRLPGAHIGGQLFLDGASLINSGGTALNAVQVTVDRDMSCAGVFAIGKVELDSAQIGKQLNFSGARLSHLGTALSAANLTVSQDMSCNNDFTATGEVSLPGSRIGGDLNLTGASLVNASGLALDIRAASIQTLRMPQKRPRGKVDLTNAKVGILADDQGSWPAVLYLRGFTYDSMENQGIGTRARLQWLKRHPGRFTPQLYDQLAAAYRRAGDEPAARQVAVAKQWRRRRAFNPLNWLWYATVGYGYRTWLALIWLAALVGLGTWIFSDAYPVHMTAISAHPPAFHAAAYALDLLLPVIGLGQKSAWQPQGSAVLYWSWVLTAAGWILTTAVVAGLTGILKRN